MFGVINGVPVRGGGRGRGGAMLADGARELDEAYVKVGGRPERCAIELEQQDHRRPADSQRGQAQSAEQSLGRDGALVEVQR